MGKVIQSKGAYSVGIAAALGFLAVHNMDKVSFKLIKGDKVEDPYGTIVGKTTFFKAITNLEEIEYADESDLGNAITGCPMGSNDGLTVIISDFFTESDWKKAVDYLCYKKKQVLLVQVLTPEEIDPVYNGRLDLIDAEAISMMDSKNMRIRIARSQQMAYEQALKDYKDEIKSYCVSRGAEFISVSTEQDIEKMLFSELLKVGIMG